MDNQDEKISNMDAQQFHLQHEQSENIKFLTKKVDLLDSKLSKVVENTNHSQMHLGKISGIMGYWFFMSIASLIGMIYYVSRMVSALDMMTNALK